ncbi:MAG: tRNA pseudouridine(55) synthase TruB [Candidatus Omnitrophica bacterium]|nr:tRNA pseudouridine(55) synthase TruB [Candidatus Omnitrophota bacterium]MBU1128840.1 tRNA pseudouridine(55) synthase TruB [Candidatus Omnitrophota bacterium]MBU1783767.1 tRNA pseudouridine(55) synthase TruB [Candidatus Omnitrophota bacterium]MBU1852140.1 tRNA pseudouridine(55) synthase TruB [Candidatus Omnitrophota bacterium]
MDPRGILVVDKPKGMTSHGVVTLVRRHFRIKKVGHAGTLDPNATGVLVLLLGKATKLSETFLNQDKEYEAVMKLGEKTDSGDSEGKVIKAREVCLTEDELQEVINDFRGDIEQIPPMFSAKKIDGKKLYKLAHKGLEVPREPVKVWIKEIEIKSVSIPMVHFRVVCSKGTYIRQLADDIGDALGCGANLAELRRIRSGEFDLEKAVAFDVLSKMGKEELHENILRT